MTAARLPNAEQAENQYRGASTGKRCSDRETQAGRLVIETPRLMCKIERPQAYSAASFLSGCTSAM